MAAFVLQVLLHVAFTTFSRLCPPATRIVHLENVMTTTTSGFEFELPGDGATVHYVVCPTHSDDGYLQKLTIWQSHDAAQAVADIGIDPQVFKSFAMPNVETVCRIAIAQAAGEGAFERPGTASDLTLDFAIEPWEGALAPA